jgi:preprotein translocase subunit SecY
MKSEKKIIKKNSSSFLDTLKGIFTNKIVLVSLSITFFLIIFFHFASTITLPGIEVPTNYKEASTSFVGMLNLLAGGGLTRMSLFAVGVGPYITAQIISQLLSSDLIKPLSKLAKAGERGRKKIEILTRIITLPFAVAQSYAVIALILNNNSNASADQMIKIFGHDSLSDMSAIETFSLIGIFSAGTYISIFIGDMITKRGVGNGVTLLILVGIVSSLFSDIQVSFLTIANKIGGFDNSVNILSIVLSCFLYILFFIIVLFIIIFVNDSVRKIPIQQTGQGLITDIDSLPYLPIKVNAAGVIPVIFASSIMTIPGTIAQFLSNGEAK